MKTKNKTLIIAIQILIIVLSQQIQAQTTDINESSEILEQKSFQEHLQNENGLLIDQDTLQPNRQLNYVQQYIENQYDAFFKWEDCILDDYGDCFIKGTQFVRFTIGNQVRYEVLTDIIIKGASEIKILYDYEQYKWQECPLENQQIACSNIYSHPTFIQFGNKTGEHKYQYQTYIQNDTLSNQQKLLNYQCSHENLNLVDYGYIKNQQKCSILVHNEKVFKIQVFQAFVNSQFGEKTFYLDKPSLISTSINKQQIFMNQGQQVCSDYYQNLDTQEYKHSACYNNQTLQDLYQDYTKKLISLYKSKGQFFSPNQILRFRWEVCTKEDEFCRIKEGTYIEYKSLTIEKYYKNSKVIDTFYRFFPYHKENWQIECKPENFGDYYQKGRTECSYLTYDLLQYDDLEEVPQMEPSILKIMVQQQLLSVTINGHKIEVEGQNNSNQIRTVNYDFKSNDRVQITAQSFGEIGEFGKCKNSAGIQGYFYFMDTFNKKRVLTTNTDLWKCNEKPPMRFEEQCSQDMFEGRFKELKQIWSDNQSQRVVCEIILP